MPRSWTVVAGRTPALSLSLLLLAGTACGPLEAEQPGEGADAPAVSRAPVVYGADDRLDVYAHPDAVLRARAQQATVALMEPADLDTRNPNDVGFNSFSLGASANLCSTERFRNDPAAAFCSGTLIDDDLVLTAGHCVTTQRECANTRFVFKYYRTSETTLETVTTEDIFSCKSIVVRRTGTTLDYGILRLDRSATPRFTPAPVNPSASARTQGEGVAVIGSGSGIPFKVDSGGTVRNARASTRDYFVANTDTFGGNSGSGVYALSDHALVGILVSGETDYVPKGSCNVVNHCTDTGCEGEDITYARRALEALCTGAGSARLCGPLPGVPTLLTPTAQALVGGARPLFSGTAAPGSGVVVVVDGNLSCSVDAVPEDGAWRCEGTTALADGTHSATARGRDTWGRESAGVSVDFRTDVVPPDTSLGDTPPSHTPSPDATFTLSASEPDVTFACRLDEGEAFPCTSPLALEGLAEGTHTLVVQARDAAGNAEPAPARFTWSVDQTAPETTLTSTLPERTAETTVTLSFSASEADARFECSLDGAPFEGCSAPRRLDGLALGLHRFEVRAKDLAGNVDASPASVAWTVEAAAPAEAPAATRASGCSSTGAGGASLALLLLAVLVRARATGRA